MMSTSPKKPKVVAIILAAGKSSRLRRPKQLLPFRGRTLIRHVAQVAVFSACYKVVVVLGAFQTRIKQEVKYLQVEVVRNSLWFHGMGGSIKEGVSFSLEKYPEADAFLFLLCDQPFVDEDYVDLMIKTYRESEKPVIASQFADTLGVPALIDARFAQELLCIDDRFGAKEFLLAHRDECAALPFSAASLDVDTPSDVERLLNLEPKQKFLET